MKGVRIAAGCAGSFLHRVPIRKPASFTSIARLSIDLKFLQVIEV